MTSHGDRLVEGATVTSVIGLVAFLVVVFGSIIYDAVEGHTLADVVVFLADLLATLALITVVFVTIAYAVGVLYCDAPAWIGKWTGGGDDE